MQVKDYRLEITLVAAYFLVWLLVFGLIILGGLS